MSWFSRKENTKDKPPNDPVRTGSFRNDALVTDHVLVFTLGAATGAVALVAWRRWGMRLRTAEWITPNELARQRWIRGVVTSRDGVIVIGTASVMRMIFGCITRLGLVGGGQSRSGVYRARDKLKDQTIHVRIAGVDAPEGAHYGRPGQPHAGESLAWLRRRIHGKTLYCQLIRKDQYGRVVGIPLLPRPFLPLFLAKYVGSSLALEMLRAGMATTYTESGAEYGPWGREQFLRVEKEARAARRGMWQNGVGIEMPGEYKKRYAAALGSPAGTREEGVDGCRQC